MVFRRRPFEAEMGVTRSLASLREWTCLRIQMFTMFHVISLPCQLQILIHRVTQLATHALSPVNTFFLELILQTHISPTMNIPMTPSLLRLGICRVQTAQIGMIRR